MAIRQMGKKFLCRIWQKSFDHKKKINERWTKWILDILNYEKNYFRLSDCNECGCLHSVIKRQTTKE